MVVANPWSWEEMVHVRGMELFVCSSNLEVDVSIFSLYVLSGSGMAVTCLFGRIFGWVKIRSHLFFIEFMLWMPLDIWVSVIGCLRVGRRLLYDVILEVALSRSSGMDYFWLFRIYSCNRSMINWAGLLTLMTPFLFLLLVVVLMIVCCSQEVKWLGGITGFPLRLIFLYGGFSYSVFPLQRDFHTQIMVDSILCPICFGSMETIDHLFAGCTDLVVI